MVLITLDGLSKAVPTAHVTDLAKYVDALDDALTRYTINTPQRIAAFIAQVAHESGDFHSSEENLNDSWQALRKTWPSHFPTDEIAQGYHRQPEKIANRAYANRNGNGDEASGDGWRFRGRGLIQITGRTNYLAYWPCHQTAHSPHAGSGMSMTLTPSPTSVTRPASTPLPTASTAAGTARTTGYRTGPRRKPSSWPSPA